MKRYAHIKAEMARLEREAQEVEGVIGRIKEAIAHYGFTAEDLGFKTSQGVSGTKKNSKKASNATSTTTVGLAKYRDPATGETWTGRGRPPNWIVSAKNRDEFLIRDDTSKASSAPAARKSSATVKVRRRSVRAAKRGAVAPTRSPSVEIESSGAAQ
ncbi:MAG TPA: H-NS histone family protein [Albitalea sp.]|uniref:H-NS histone family protein n=1 Tax=Piscinibacter sp. TaxID=1903157 RepID=UPI002ED0E1CC